MKRVLITGASGFIGRRAVPMLLERGYEIHAVARRASNVRANEHQVDILQGQDEIARVVARVRPTHLLHLAWCTQPGEYWTSIENLQWVEASLKLVRSFVASGGSRVVCAGTCAEYDWSYRYCSEDDTPLRPSSLYGVSKNALREMLDAFAQKAGFSFAWSRIFFPYGPGEHSARLISSLAHSLLRGKPATCRNGTLVRDYIYVEDVARAIVALLDSDVEGAINVGSGRPTRIDEIARAVAATLQRNDLLEFLEGEEDQFRFVVADTHRLTAKLRFVPAVNLDEGVERTLQWCRSQLDRTRL